MAHLIEVSDLFLSKGRIVSTKGRNTPERTWEAVEEGTFDGFPMAVLVNHYSASASEILSASLQDHKRAVVIGERTWGKGSVQNVIELEGGKSALKLTTASYFRPSGKNIHRFPDSKDSDEWGVMPDAGFELALNVRQTEQLIRNRRERDILVAKHGKSSETPPAEANVAEKTGEKAAEPAEEKKPADADKTSEEKPADKSSDAKPADEKPTEEKPADAKPADEKPAEPAKPEEAKSAEAKPAFIDLQLQKALDYLSQELARAQ